MPTVAAKDARLRIEQAVFLIRSSAHVQEHSAVELFETAAMAIDATTVPTKDRTVYQSLANMEMALTRAARKRPEARADDLAGPAIRSMLSLLGDGSGYLSGADVEKLPSAAGKPTTGITLQSGRPFPVVAAVAARSAAAQSGVLVGDELLSVDGLETRDVELAEIRTRLTGAPNTRAILQLRTPGTPLRTVTLARASSGAPRMECRVLGRKMLYVRIPALAPEVARALGDVGRAAGEMARGLILDLRGASDGGYEEAAVIADLLIASGPTLRFVVRSKVEKRSASPGTSELERSRIVVLVDGETDGLAEAIAAALQDSKRGKILGTPTKGSGEIRAYYVLQGPSFLRLVVGHLTRPDGSALAGVGVRPDLTLVEADSAPRLALDDEECPGGGPSHPLGADPWVMRAAAELSRP